MGEGIVTTIQAILNMPANLAQLTKKLEALDKRLTEVEGHVKDIREAITDLLEEVYMTPGGGTRHEL